MNIQVLTSGPKMVPHKSVLKISYKHFFFTCIHVYMYIFISTPDFINEKNTKYEYCPKIRCKVEYLG